MNPQESSAIYTIALKIQNPCWRVALKMAQESDYRAFKNTPFFAASATSSCMSKGSFFHSFLTINMAINLFERRRVITSYIIRFDAGDQVCCLQTSDFFLVLNLIFFRPYSLRFIFLAIGKINFDLYKAEMEKDLHETLKDFSLKHYGKLLLRSVPRSKFTPHRWMILCMMTDDITKSHHSSISNFCSKFLALLFLSE